MVKIGDMVQNIAAANTPAPFIGSLSRTKTDATGTVPYTGIGFTPSYVIFFGFDNGNTEASWGFDNGSQKASSVYSGYASAYTGLDAYSIFSHDGVSDEHKAAIQSLDTDGFTLSWTKVGSPTGTFTVKFMAFK